MDYKKIKAKLLNILIQLSNIYEDINKSILFFWRKALKRQTPNRWTNAIKTLIENPATALFLNTILFSLLARLFGGAIANVLSIGAALNIILFCANILGWKNKLKK